MSQPSANISSGFHTSNNFPSQSYMSGSASPSVNAHIEADDDENGENNIDISGENDIGDAEGENNALHKKKKKKKPKKSATAKAKEAAEKAAKMKGSESKPPVLCISRNKHWRYISSYHGPWLQLPIELLESLLALNLDPATLSSEPPSLSNPSFSTSTGFNLPNNLSVPGGNVRLRDQGLQSLNSFDMNGIFTNPNAYPTFDLAFPPTPSNSIPSPRTGTAPPPPIDPGVFRSVASIRRLIDEAAELSVRATSGLSAAELGSMRGSPLGAPSGYGGGYGSNSAWAAAQTLGINPNVLAGGRTPGGGRNVAMSAMRIHRLRALAVQKLAEAYKQDEIASSVMVMQGGSVFDDIAERVLKVDPNDANAKYVHFFHEKIPSRQLAESTTTEILDDLILAHPHRLEYFRTRGIVHCFRDEYQQAIRDFTHALKEARSVRKSRSSHSSFTHSGKRHGFGGHGNGRHANGYGYDRGGGAHTPTKHSKMPKKRGKTGGKGGKSGKVNGQAPPNGTSFAAYFESGDFDGDGDGDDDYNYVEDEEGRARDGDSSSPLPHPSVLPDAPDPIEPQLLFLRGSAFLQHAVWLIEQAVLKLEGIDPNQPRPPSSGAPLPDNGELRLCYLQDGKYGGVEVGNPQGPLGANDGAKVKAYREVLGDKRFKEQIYGMLRKSIRDHEKFLGHFDSLEVQAPYSFDPAYQGAYITEVDGKGKGVDEEDLEEIEERRRKKEERNRMRKKVEHAFYLSESIRPGNQGASPTATPMPSPGVSSSTPTSPTSTQLAIPGSYLFEGSEPVAPSPSTVFTTYHPLLVESHFSILLCMMLLGDFQKILPTFVKTAALVDGLEGYPVFLPPRSMAQAEFVEVLERLASGWKRGTESDDQGVQEQSIAERTVSTRSSTPTSSTSGEASASVSGFGSSAANSGCSTPMTSSVELSEPVPSSTLASGSRSTPTCVSPVQPSMPSKPHRLDHGAGLSREDAPEALDALRILLAPVIARQKLRAEQAAAERVAEKAEAKERRERAVSRAKDKTTGEKDDNKGSEKKKPMTINIPLHGPRVEVVLAWLGGVHLPELEF